MTTTFTFADNLQLDVYSAPSPAGVVIYIHGGGFAAGDRTMDAGRCEALAAHGLTVVAIDYRLAPAKYPAQTDDVTAAIEWVRTHPAEVGLENPGIALWGASAGAVLASLVGLTAEPAVQAVVSWFGVGDVISNSARSPLEAHLLPPGPGLTLMGVETLEGNEDLAREVSPITHVSANAPAFLVAHGDRDHVVEVTESVRLHDALTHAGASSTLLLVGGAGHEDPLFDAPASIAMTAAFMRGHL